MTKFKFYVVMVLSMIVLLGNAIVSSMIVDQRKNAVRLKKYETLSYEQCAERYQELVKEFEVRPKTGKEYLTVISRAYRLEGSARKAMQHPPATWTDKTGRDFRIDDIVRSIPVRVQENVNQYANWLGPIADKPEYRVALKEFEKSGFDPLYQPDVPVPGAERVLFGWLLFHFGAMPFIAIHFSIQLRARGLKISHDVFGNPMFPFWLFFWEVGLFRYPMKVSPTEQLRRAQRWATLVLSSVLPCFAGTGKLCEEKPQPAAQHQRYDGVWSRASFSTTTLSEYLGLDGGNFFDAPVQQTVLTFALPCGVSIGMFDSEPLGKRDLRPNFGREVDLMVGWRRTFGNYTVDASATYLDVFPLKQTPRGDVVLFTERLTRKISLGKQSAVSPYIWLRQAMPTRGPTPAHGNFVHGGATFSQTLNDHVSMSVAADALHDSGAFGYRPGYIGRLVGGMNRKLGHGVSLQIPQITFTDPLSRTRDGRHPEFALGFGITFSPAY